MNYTRLRILELDGTEAFDTGGDELIVLPLAGLVHASTIDGERSSSRAARACSARSPTSPTRRATRTCE